MASLPHCLMALLETEAPGMYRPAWPSAQADLKPRGPVYRGGVARLDVDFPVNLALTSGTAPLPRHAVSCI